MNFNQPGSIIKVPNLGKAKRTPIAHIIADKGRKQVRGYGSDGKLKVAYPSTIGSSDTPSPSGTVQVKRIAINPNYTYNPRINFKQGANEGVLTIPPGQTVPSVRYGLRFPNPLTVFMARLTLHASAKHRAMAACVLQTGMQKNSQESSKPASWWCSRNKRS